MARWHGDPTPDVDVRAELLDKYERFLERFGGTFPARNYRDGAVFAAGYAMNIVDDLRAGRAVTVQIWMLPRTVRRQLDGDFKMSDFVRVDRRGRITRLQRRNVVETDGKEA